MVPRATSEQDPAGRRRGVWYQLLPGDRQRFDRDGFVHLPGVLSDDEVTRLEPVFERFLRREIPVAGRDYCDMSGDYERPGDAFELYNIMLPRVYYPAWRGHIYELRAASIAQQLLGPDMVLDYDQLLAKRPGAREAVFHWHQDQAYWPLSRDPRTATCWLALDAADEENGAMRFVPGSHREARLRPHAPLLGDRDRSHTLVASVGDADTIHQCRLQRGDITVHGERLLHGSGGNRSTRWRRAYVVAFRSRETVAEERRRGFTHSHNDSPEVLGAVGEAG